MDFIPYKNEELGYMPRTTKNVSGQDLWNNRHHCSLCCSSPRFV